MKKVILLLCSIMLSVNVAFADSSAVKTSEISHIEKYLDKFSNHIGFNGNVLVAKNNEILFSKSYGYSDIKRKIPLNPKSEFHIASITKQFTSVAILKLVQDKQISLEDKISNLIPEFANAPWAQGVTINHLLHHTSGIYEPSPIETPKFSKIEEVIDYFKDKPSASKPGKIFMYSNFGYNILAYIVQKITHKPLGIYFKEAFFDPLEMHSTYLSLSRPPLKSSTNKNQYLALPHEYKTGGIIDRIDHYIFDNMFDFGDGGLISTSEDLLKWNNALYEGQIIPKQLLEKFTTPNSFGYGLGIFVETFANGDVIYRHGGAIDGYNSMLIYLPARKVTICIWTNIFYPDGHRLDALIDNLILMIE